MSMSRQDCIDLKNDLLWDEFYNEYTERDLFTRYCEEYQIILTPETPDNYSEEHFQEWLEGEFNQYKECRD